LFPIPNGNGVARDLAQSADGTMLVVGSQNIGPFLVKLTSAGRVVWARFRTHKKMRRSALCAPAATASAEADRLARTKPIAGRPGPVQRQRRIVVRREVEPAPAAL